MGATTLTTSTTTADVAEWRSLLASYTSISCALDRALAEFELGMSDYEVLERLAEAGAKGQPGICKARVQQLASEVHLSQSALSRVIARLERAGLVERAMCAEDRRGIFVQLTAAGAQRQQDAEPAHRAVLAEHLH
jgi:DNA-binding MarR family transcriptional regulator